MPPGYRPRMPPERVELLRRWHERAYQRQRARRAIEMSFLGLDLRVDEHVFAPHGDELGDPFHQAVAAEVRDGDRVLDMGTGCGVSGILAARAGAGVVAVDVNPRAVRCARENASRNGVADRMTVLESDLFAAVRGRFDLIVFDPPFRWFAPRDLLEMGTADEGYGALTRFMTEARAWLRDGGRILLNFGTSGDIEYLRRLIERERYASEWRRYGEATRDGLTVRYYVIRLTVPGRR